MTKKEAIEEIEDEPTLDTEEVADLLGDFDED